MRLEDFKSLIFAHNPKMYSEMFPQTEEMVLDDQLVQSPDFEWMGGDEALEMMKEMGFQ